MAQQTAVEWLINQLKIRGYAGEFPPHLLFEHSKQMEKEQIIKAYNQDLYGGLSGDKKFDDGEQYYNETFGNK